jgi:hypothetical protein
MSAVRDVFSMPEETQKKLAELRLAAAAAADAKRRTAAEAATVQLRSALVPTAQVHTAQKQEYAARGNTAPPQPLLRGFRNAPMRNNTRPITVAPATRGRRPNVRNKGNYQNQIRIIEELTSLDVTPDNIHRIIDLVTDNTQYKAVCELFLSKIHMKLDSIFYNSNEDTDIPRLLFGGLYRTYISLIFQLLDLYRNDRKICDLGCSILLLLNKLAIQTEEHDKYLDRLLTDEQCRILFDIVRIQFDKSYYVLSTINIIHIYLLSHTSVLTPTIAKTFIISIIAGLVIEPELKSYKDINIGLCSIVDILRICITHFKDTDIISVFIDLGGISCVWRLREFIDDSLSDIYEDILFKLLCIIASDPKYLRFLTAEPDIFTFIKATILSSKYEISPDTALAITNILLMNTPDFIDSLFGDEKLTVILDILNNSDEMPLPIFCDLFRFISSKLSKSGVLNNMWTYYKLLTIITSIYIASNPEKKDMIRPLIQMFHDYLIKDVFPNKKNVVHKLSIYMNKFLTTDLNDGIIINFLEFGQRQWESIEEDRYMWVKCAIRIKAYKYIIKGKGNAPPIFRLYKLLTQRYTEVIIDIPANYIDPISTDNIKQGDQIVRIENRLDNGTIEIIFMLLSSWNDFFKSFPPRSDDGSTDFRDLTWDVYIKSIINNRNPFRIEYPLTKIYGRDRVLPRLTGPLKITTPLSIIMGVANIVPEETPLTTLGGRRRTIRRRTSKRKTRRHR